MTPEYDDCEAIDAVGVEDSDEAIDPDDMTSDLGKLAKYVESDAPFPQSLPQDLIRRSKARRRALKKKHNTMDMRKCECDNYEVCTEGPDDTTTIATTSTSRPASAGSSASASTPIVVSDVAASPKHRVDSEETVVEWPAVSSLRMSLSMSVSSFFSSTFLFSDFKFPKGFL